MRRVTKWAVGAAAVVVPILAGASPAAAATASDDEAVGPFTFIANGGEAVLCSMSVIHTVDSGTGEIAAGVTVGGNAACRGTLFINIQYVDDHGDASHADASSRQSVLQNLFVYDAGSTAVTVDHQVIFDDCERDCMRSLQTKTK
jgi:hypothetical protein